MKIITIIKPSDYFKPGFKMNIAIKGLINYSKISFIF